ncbi:hypothetical protein [Micromonospora sp. RTGN7]|uniref:hypothetical protein n=1 Tax=Micromonospora sp. RTGN7 TaxID=3016526 RepID=UPI0029FEE84C|nr:hypothetical protein [Micromonospora sp. RTGN7]
MPADAVRGEPHQREDDIPGLGIQLLDIPVARVEDPRARAYIVDHLKPGTTIHRRVEVRNTSAERQRVALYAGAAAVEGNAFTVSDGRTGNELTGWVTLESTSVDLPPGGSEPVEVTIAVPKSASKGERYGAVWAQITSRPKDAGNISQIHRVGIRMYLDIGPGGEPPTDFRIDALAAERGTGPWPMVTARVTNTGGRALDMGGTLSLANESGAVRAGPFTVTKGVTILPGENGQVGVELNQTLPAGRWDVRLTLVSGTVEHTAEGRITLPVAADVVPVKSAMSRWIALSLGAGTALLALVTAILWYLARRRGPFRVGARIA